MKRACDLGSAKACNDLGVAENDFRAAQHLVERACDLGFVRGCANLGYILLMLGEDHDRAVKLLDAACAADDPFACTKLGDAWYDDPKQLAKAAASYEKACSLNYDPGCLNEGWMLLDGKGAPRDTDRAVSDFKLSCNHGNAAGCSALGYALVGLAKNEAEETKGLEWLTSGCEHDDGFGCFVLANQEAKKQRELTREARTHYEKACRLGIKQACNVQIGERSASSPADSSDEESEDGGSD